MRLTRRLFLGGVSATALMAARAMATPATDLLLFGGGPNGGATPPFGFAYLTGADGAYLLGADGAYLYGVSP